jgi:nicotinamidase-related amidase
LIKINFRPFVGHIFAPPKPTLSGVLSLPLRQREGPVGGTEQSPASGGGHRTNLKRLSIAETAVVIVDPWARHECPGWEARASDNLLKFLLPALMAFRSIGIPIIYAPHDRKMSPAIQPAEGELVMQGILAPRDIAQGLKAAGITHLIYMGYASNWCLMSRPIGAMNMWHEGFGIIVVRDASIALETSESFAGEWSHRIMMDFVEATLGATTSVDEIRQSVDRIEID